MSYRPITDMWILARAKLKPHADGSKRSYYGAYLGGFPERARALLGVSNDDPVLHVCGGMARHYPYRGGFGPNDQTLDLDPLAEPDFVQDCRQPLPRGFKAILADPPYSEQDAASYNVGAAAYPSPGLICRNAMDALLPGQRVGIIHYALPKQPANTRFVACIGVVCGFGNRLRCYSVFEKIC